MYRLLATDGEVHERLDQLRHPRYTAPELLATRPTSSGAGTSPSSRGRRSGPTSTSYVILDIFSRYVVGWMIARQSAVLARELMSSAGGPVAAC